MFIIRNQYELSTFSREPKSLKSFGPTGPNTDHGPTPVHTAHTDRPDRHPIGAVRRSRSGQRLGIGGNAPPGAALEIATSSVVA